MAIRNIISNIMSNKLVIAIVISGILLIVLLAIILYYFPNINLTTNINGTLFVAIITGIVSITGIILKSIFDLFDSEKKKNEKLLEATLGDVEEYYYPIAIAAQTSALHLIETIKRLRNLNATKKELQESKPEMAELGEKIGSILGKEYIFNPHRMAYSLYLIGSFYHHRFKLEAEKGGDIILRNLSQEIFLRDLYNRVNEAMIWTFEEKDKITFHRSVLQSCFLNNTKSHETNFAYTYAKFYKNISNANGEVSEVYLSFLNWLKRNPQQALEAAHLLKDYGVWVERYVRELSTYWYHDNPKRAKKDKEQQEQDENKWRNDIRNLFLVG